MKTTHILILAIAFLQLSGSGVKAQETGFSASIGGGNFQMDDLKTYQEYLLSTYPVEGKILSSFPPYTSISLNLFKQVYPSLKIGGGYGYSTTGGRLNYSDFSGNVSTSTNVMSYKLGAFLSYTIIGGEHLALSLYGRVDGNFTRLKVISSIYAAGLSNGVEDKYKSFSPNTSAGLDLMYSFEKFALGLDGGYLLDFPSELSSVESGGRLYDPADAQQVITADWTGWRASLKIILWLEFNQ